MSLIQQLQEDIVKPGISLASIFAESRNTSLPTATR